MFDDSLTESCSVHTLYLEPDWRLDFKPKRPDIPWSVALNFLVSFELADYVDADVALFVEYRDGRGKHRLLVDKHQIEFEKYLLFSNLLQLPIRGDIEEMSLKLVGVPADIDVLVELVRVQVEEKRSFVDNQPVFARESLPEFMQHYSKVV